MNIKSLALLSIASLLIACTSEDSTQPTTYTCTNAQAKPVTGVSELVPVFLSSINGNPTVGFNANERFFKHNECGPSVYSTQNGDERFIFYQYNQKSGDNNHSLSGYGANLEEASFSYAGGYEAVTGTFRNGHGHKKEYISKNSEINGSAWVTRKEWSNAVANNKTKHTHVESTMDNKFTNLSYSEDRYVIIDANNLYKAKYFNENTQTYTCQYISKTGSLSGDTLIQNCEGQNETDADIRLAQTLLDTSSYFNALQQSPSFNTEKGRFCRDMNRFGYVCDSRGIQ